ncbi:MAG: hypothetical protein ACR2H5_23855 [Ktedonobacteraceae bacterium]
MAEIAKSGVPSLSSIGLDPGTQKLPPLYTGEAIAAGDACYIKNDGTIWRSTGAAVAAAAKVRGFAPTKANVGEVLTLVKEIWFAYGAALTPGADYYLSGTVVGGIADAASTGGTAPIGYAIDATRVYVTQSRY